jgi:hypothetical protein
LRCPLLRRKKKNIFYLFMKWEKILERSSIYYFYKHTKRRPIQ